MKFVLTTLVRISCNNKKKRICRYTEGYQVNNDETFVSVLKKQILANLGVSSCTYGLFRKIKYYIDKIINSKLVIRLIDISDIDETRGYKYSDKKKENLKNF